MSQGCDAQATNVLDSTALDLAAAAGHATARHHPRSPKPPPPRLNLPLQVESYLSSATGSLSSTSRKMAVRLDIFEAAKRGDVKRMRQLIEVERADPNKLDQDGATCLMFAAMRGHTGVVELLLANKANVDLQDAISGWTALIQATYYGHKAIVRTLIDAGANVSLQAKNACTAYDIASLIGDTDVVRLLAAVSLGPEKRRPGVMSSERRAERAPGGRTGSQPASIARAPLPLPMGADTKPIRGILRHARPRPEPLAAAAANTGLAALQDTGSTFDSLKAGSAPAIVVRRPDAKAASIRPRAAVAAPPNPDGPPARTAKRPWAFARALGRLLSGRRSVDADPSSAPRRRWSTLLSRSRVAPTTDASRPLRRTSSGTLGSLFVKMQNVVGALKRPPIVGGMPRATGLRPPPPAAANHRAGSPTLSESDESEPEMELGSQRRPSVQMGPPISKLTASILAPIKPPFLPPPVFAAPQIRVERPKIERRPSGASSSAGESPPPRPSRVRFEFSTDAGPLRRTEPSKLARSSRGSQSASSPQRQQLARPIQQHRPPGTIEALLKRERIEHLSALFAEQEIDLVAFATLTTEDCPELGIAPGDVQAVMRAVQVAKASDAAGGLTDAVAAYHRI